MSKRAPLSLVIGCNGQIGSSLMEHLKRKGQQVIGADIRIVKNQDNIFHCDVTSRDSLHNLINMHRPNRVFHLGAILSGAAELDPDLAFKVNILGVHNLFQIARESKGSFSIFLPSSIAVYGPVLKRSTKGTNESASTKPPSSLYGMHKAFAEMLGQYCWSSHGIDFRSLRLPGVLSGEALAEGLGTTDYAAEMVYNLLRYGHYTCFIPPNQRLPMIWLHDCLEAMEKLMDAPNDNLTRRVYNIQGLSFTPSQLYQSIKRVLGSKVKVDYKPDFRAAIASTWPKNLDDSAAKIDWQWQPTVDSIDAIVKRMIAKMNVPIK